MSSGIFARMGNLWKGFVSLWISDIEKEHPEIAYENAIGSMIEKYAQLKKATAAIIRRREDLSERYGSRTKELAQVEAELNTAVETSQDDLAVILLQKKSGARGRGRRAQDRSRHRAERREQREERARDRAERDPEAPGREGQHDGQDGERAGAHSHQRAARRPQRRRRDPRRSTTSAVTSRTPSPRRTSVKS